MDEYNPRICPVCGQEFDRNEMFFTYDCHGIPFRLVCSNCYDIIMCSKGYDGELYTELDENIWEE